VLSYIALALPYAPHFRSAKRSILPGASSSHLCDRRAAGYSLARASEPALAPHRMGPPEAKTALVSMPRSFALYAYIGNWHIRHEGRKAVGRM